MPPYIYLNGYPGVGKLTIAKELQKLIPASKVFDNHLIIDPVAAIFERSDPEYQPLRKLLRQQILSAISSATSINHLTWIFTDQAESDIKDSSSVMDYRDAAVKRGCPLVSIILNCDLDENLRRAMSHGRSSGGTTKLTDPDIVRMIRNSEGIFRFKDEYELELDVTLLSSQEAAQEIWKHIQMLSLA